MNRQHVIEPYSQDENDWLYTVEFLPSDDPEGRVFAADIVGYLFGYLIELLRAFGISPSDLTGTG